MSAVSCDTQHNHYKAWFDTGLNIESSLYHMTNYYSMLQRKVPEVRYTYYLNHNDSQVCNQYQIYIDNTLNKFLISS